MGQRCGSVTPVTILPLIQHQLRIGARGSAATCRRSQGSSREWIASLAYLTSAPRRCYASLKWIGDDPQQHQQNQEHNNDADDATNAISRSRCGAPIAIATAAIEATAIAKSAEQNDDDNNQHESAHDSPPNA